MTGFKGQATLNDASPLEKVENNIKAWMDWGFLKQGGYTNIYVPTSGHYGGDWSRLYPVTDPRFPTARIWEGPRKGWVWENGTGRSPEPIRVSGIEIDGTFKFFTSHTPDAGNKIEGYVDYENGRIYLGSGIPINSTVRASYTYKWVHTYKSDGVSFLQQVQYNSHRPDNPQSQSRASGDWSTLAETRVQLPAISIEYARGNSKPYALGGGHYSYNEFVCYCVGQTETDSKRMAFILGEQEEKKFRGYDEEKVGRSGAFPINGSGFLDPNPLKWTDLANTYPFADITIVKANIEATHKVNDKLYYTPVSLRTETILPENY